MDRDVNTKTAAVVLTFFVFIIASWTYFNTQSLLVDAPSFVKQHPNGNLFFQLGNDFYEATPEGKDIHHFALSFVGITQTIGDFDFFSNGDLLLYATDYHPSFKENVKTIIRAPDSSAREAGESEGFYRCDIYQGNCTRFGQDLPVFTRGFRLIVDSNDNVYIADTSRHRLIKVSPSGEKIGSLATGLKFPNDLYWQDDSLWVVNTNHHEVLEIAATTSNFGEKLSSFKASLPRRKFPADLERVGNTWLVLTMDNDMQRGKLAQFSFVGEQMSIVDLERGADIVGVISTGGRVILPDVKHMRYRSINSKNLEPANDFVTPKIEAHLAKSRSSVLLYNTLCWSLIGLGVLGFVLLAYVAIKSETKAIDKDLEPITEDVSLDAELPEGVEEYWIPKSSQFTKVQKCMRWFIPVSAMIIIILMVPVMLNESSSKALLVPGVTLVAIMYFTWRLLKKTGEMDLGVSPKGVLIRDHLGNIYFGKGSEVSTSMSAIVLKNALVMKKLFDIKELEKWIKPRLRNANKVGEMQVIAKQWEVKHPALMEPLKICLVALVVMGLMELMG